jgi:endonuclease/exonuclease/phosphatase family metal-dependent hydrolase
VTRCTTRPFLATLLLAFISTSASAQSLPTGWATRDIGPVGATGAAFGSLSAFTVTGAGADIWDTSDQFRFLYTSLTGDGSIVTQVASVQYVHNWTKVGVMMRESLYSTSRQASMLVTPTRGVWYMRRTTTNGVTTSAAGPTGSAGAAAIYVRLTRAGSVFTAAKSIDGVTWTTVASETINMGSTIYVGLAVSSHVTGVLSTANFVSTSVTAGATATAPAPAPAPEPAPAPAPAPAPSTTSTLKFLHWNVHHGGQRSDGYYDPNGLTTWIASWAPHVISLNEVENTSQLTTIVNYLNAKTGTAWNYKWDGRGNVVLSRLPMTNSSVCLTNAAVGRKLAHLSVLLNGRPLNVWSGHFALDSSAVRVAEAVLLQGCEAGWPEARLVGMDFNAGPDTPEYNSMLTGHTDAWRSAPTKLNYSGNCDGCTRNSRIDYIWTSRGASWLTLTSAQIVDTRNADGVMASDHKPLIVVYSVAP